MKEFILALFIIMLMFVTSLAANSDRIEFTVENTTKVTKLMHLKKMDQPCYVDPFGYVRCYHTRMMAEMRSDNYTRKNNHDLEKNVGDRFCIEWSNISSNQEKFEAEYCVVIEEDTAGVHSTPDGLTVKKIE